MQSRVSDDPIRARPLDSVGTTSSLCTAEVSAIPQTGPV